MDKHSDKNIYNCIIFWCNVYGDMSVPDIIRHSFISPSSKTSLD